MLAVTVVPILIFSARHWPMSRALRAAPRASGRTGDVGGVGGVGGVGDVGGVGGVGGGWTVPRRAVWPCGQQHLTFLQEITFSAQKHCFLQKSRIPVQSGAIR